MTSHWRSGWLASEEDGELIIHSIHGHAHLEDLSVLLQRALGFYMAD